MSMLPRPLPVFLCMTLLAGNLAAAPPPARPMRHKPPSTTGTAQGVLCLDQRMHPAWWVLQAVADAAAPCPRPGMRRLTPDTPAAESLQRLWADWVRRRSMGTQDVPAYAATLAASMPGVPIGLTWDGGLAITAGDYAAAEARHAAFLRGPHDDADPH